MMNSSDALYLNTSPFIDPITSTQDEVLDRQLACLNTPPPSLAAKQYHLGSTSKCCGHDHHHHHSQQQQQRQKTQHGPPCSPPFESLSSSTLGKRSLFKLISSSTSLQSKSSTAPTRPPLMLENIKEWPFCPMKRAIANTRAREAGTNPYSYMMGIPSKQSWLWALSASYESDSDSDSDIMKQTIKRRRTGRFLDEGGCQNLDNLSTIQHVV